MRKEHVGKKKHMNFVKTVLPLKAVRLCEKKVFEDELGFMHEKLPTHVVVHRGVR